MMEYSGISIKKDVGKPGNTVAKFKGDYEGIEAVLTLKAESQEDIEDIIPLTSRELELKVIDPNRKLDEFQKKEPAILEDFILGIPVETDFVAGQCSVCGAEMWKDPADLEPVCVACQKEIASEIFRKEEKERLRQKRMKTTSTEPTILRLPDETLDEYEERKQLFEEEGFREERRQRMEAQT